MSNHANTSQEKVFTLLHKLKLNARLLLVCLLNFSAASFTQPE